MDHRDNESLFWVENSPTSPNFDEFAYHFAGLRRRPVEEAEPIYSWAAERSGDDGGGFGADIVRRALLHRDGERRATLVRVNRRKAGVGYGRPEKLHNLKGLPDWHAACIVHSSTAMHLPMAAGR